MVQRQRLSHKSVLVLQEIAAGRTYAQILALHPQLSYLDLLEAATEALLLNETPPSSIPNVDAGDPPAATPSHLDQIKAKHPRAYHPWTTDEDQRVTALHFAGNSFSDIKAILERQPSAIRSRLIKLGCLEKEPDEPVGDGIAKPLDWMM